jgi:nucleoside-diphosphate-sugar epimerase
MQLVVTGGSGFIGSHVVNSLREAGHNVLNIDRNGKDAQILDICDTAAMAEAFSDFRAEYVFHLAGVADARQTLTNPVESVQVNVVGTTSVLQAAKQTGIKRVLLASTCWVANAMGDGILDETQPFLPTGGGHVYSTTKIASELLAHDFQKLYGLPFTILRYGIPYGPRMWPGLVLRNFFDNAAAGKPLTIFGDGSASRRFVYVEDLARAHVLALQDVAANQTYNLEGMRFVAIKELAELFLKLWGEGEITYRPESTRLGEFQYFRKILSNNKAYIELGWQPEVDLEEGVRRTLEWYKREESQDCIAKVHVQAI